MTRNGVVWWWCVLRLERADLTFAHCRRAVRPGRAATARCSIVAVVRMYGISCTPHGVLGARGHGLREIQKRRHAIWPRITRLPLSDEVPKRLCSQESGVPAGTGVFSFLFFFGSEPLFPSPVPPPPPHRKKSNSP